MSTVIRKDYPFALVGDNWSDVGESEGAIGVFLLIVRAGGHTYHLGTKDCHVRIGKDLPRAHFVAAIKSDFTYKEQVNLFSPSYSTKRLNVHVMGDYLPLNDLRKAGVVLQTIDVEVYWYIDRIGHDLDQGIFLMKGKLSNPSFDSTDNEASFSVVQEFDFGSESFPPIVATDERITNLNAESYGEVYPIVIGDVKKLPIFCSDTGSNTDFLIMQDPNAEFSGSPVSDAYDGDTTLAVALQGYSTDNLGDGFWEIRLTAAATGGDITCDVTGHEPATIDETIKYLMSYYGGDKDIVRYDTAMLQEIASELAQIELGVAFNRTEESMIKTLIDRFSNQFPIYFLFRAGKMFARPITWGKMPVRRSLSIDKQLFKKVSAPTETSLDTIYNSFVVRYGRSGFRGDYTGCVTRNWDNDNACRLSKNLYGKRAMSRFFDAGDVVNENGANYIIDWLVTQYSKMRVQVSYLATLEAADLIALDEIRVYDGDEGWDHGPRFKIVGIHYATAPFIRLDLISVDDYSEVYGYNK